MPDYTIFDKHRQIFPEITVQTRVGKDSEIKNEQINIPLPLRDLKQASDYEKEFPFVTYRTNSCGYYNCHGMTFASRRTRIFDSDDIMRILNEDTYKKINNFRNVLPGDIVIYFRKYDPQHSGIVVGIPNPAPDYEYKIWVLSKWGHGQETIHLLNDCPYSNNCDSKIYYRIHSIYHGERL